MLRQLLYISAAAPEFREADLADILNASRRNNDTAGVTGLLCYMRGGFVQVLEGPWHAVQTTYDRVAEDRRHVVPMVLLDREVAARSFGQWRMGYRRLCHAEGPAGQRAFELSRAALAMAMPQDGAGELLALFETFYDAHDEAGAV